MIESLLKVGICLALAAATTAVTFCQASPAKKHTTKHRTYHRTKYVSKPKPTPRPVSGSVMIAGSPKTNESYLVHPDGRWEWLPTPEPEVHAPAPTPVPSPPKVHRGDPF